MSQVGRSRTAGGNDHRLCSSTGNGDQRMWNREFSLLADDHRVARYNLRGYGGSTVDFGILPRPRPRGPARPLGLDTAVGCWSQHGGKIAIDLTLAHPERVGALLLIAPGYSGMDYDHVPGGKATFERDERLSKAAADASATGKVEEASEHLRQLWASALTGSRSICLIRWSGKTRRKSSESVLAVTKRGTVRPPLLAGRNPHPQPGSRWGPRQSRDAPLRELPRPGRRGSRSRANA